MARERNESGEFVEEITLEEVLDVLRVSDSPVVTAKEVGEALNCSGEAARQKLLALRDRDIVARRQVGGSAVVWWLIEEGATLDERQEFDPEDPLFSGDALLDPDDPVDETEIDDVLYSEG